MPTLSPGAIVSYNHPAWGHCTGTVEYVRDDGMLLVQDHHHLGAREWVALDWLVSW